MALSTVGSSLLSGSLSPLFLLATIILTTVFFLAKKKTNLPSGPWGIIPYLGYAPNIAYALYRGEELQEYLVKLGQKYGKIYSFKVFGMPIIVLNDYQAMREAFQDTKLNDRGENDMQIKVYSRSFNRWIDMGPFRTFVLTCFRQFGIGTSRFEESIARESTFLIEEIAKLKGQPVDLKGYLNNAVTNIISKVVLGTRFEFTDERIQRLTGLLNQHNVLSGAGGLELMVPINIPSKAKREMDKVADELLEFIDGQIVSHRKSFDPNNLNDVIDMWLDEIRRKESDDPYSFRYPENLPGEVYLLFLAGTDTTATTLLWTFHYLVRYPEVQARIHQELDAAIGRNQLPKLADKPNIPYTQAVLLEIQRMIAIVPLSVFHVAGEETSFRGYSIPKNTVVIPNLYAVLHSPEVWGDPEVFRPERFLDADGKLCERKEMIPCGIGRRICLGEALAKQELYIFFSQLLHQFKFEETCEGAALPTLKPIQGIVTRPEEYKIRIIQRD